MGLISSIKNIFGRADAKNDAPAKVIPSSSGDYYDLLWNAPKGMKVATVYRCVQVLSDMVAQLPMLYQKRRNGVYVQPDDDQNLNYLLNIQGDDTQSAYDMRKKLVSEVLLEGNAYVVYDINHYTGEYERMTVCTRGSVQHDTSNDLYTVNDTINGIQGTYKEDEIIHVKGYAGINPKVGISVLSHAATSIDIAGAGDAETLKRFVKGGNLRGILKQAMTGQGLDGYDPKQLDKLSAWMEEKLSRNFCVVPTPMDASLEVLSMTSADMQFLESRKFAVRDICRFFGVHPSFVFDDTSNNYKSAEMANVAFLSQTLNPLLCKIEMEFSRKLIGKKSAARRRIVFDRSSLYSLDLDSKVKYYSQMIAAGAMTVNDVRAAENMPAVEGGDKVFVSANLKWIDDPLFAGSKSEVSKDKSKEEDGN